MVSVVGVHSDGLRESDTSAGVLCEGSWVALSVPGVVDDTDAREVTVEPGIGVGAMLLSKSVFESAADDENKGGRIGATGRKIV